MLAVFHAGEKFRSALHIFENGAVNGSVQDFWFGFSAEVQNEFGALNGFADFAGDLGGQIISDEMDGRSLGSVGGTVTGPQKQFEMGDFEGILLEQRLNGGGEVGKQFTAVEIANGRDADGAVQPAEERLGLVVNLGIKWCGIAGGVFGGHQAMEPFVQASAVTGGDGENAGIGRECAE